MASDNGFMNLEQLRLLANSDLLKYQLLVYFDLKTQREVQLATEINNLTRQLFDIIDERRSFIGELEKHLPTNVMAYKRRQEPKCHQKDDMIRAMEMRSTVDTREGGEESVMSTQEYIRKVIEDVGEDDDFTRVSLLSMIDYVNVDGGIVKGCFGDGKKFLKNVKLEQIVAVIKSCTPNALGDLTVTLKDFS
nr:hypothetical protein [Tanacetum cinerariifolium]